MLRVVYKIVNMVLQINFGNCSTRNDRIYMV